MSVTAERFTCAVADAAKVVDWFRTRGGVAIWGSVDLSDPGVTWTTPVLRADGTPAAKPSWQAADTPLRCITDMADMDVLTSREVGRFRVGIKRAQGWRWDVTDAGSRRIRKAVQKAAEAAGKDAWHTFAEDGAGVFAVIVVEDERMSLQAWAEQLEGGRC